MFREVCGKDELWPCAFSAIFESVGNLFSNSPQYLIIKKKKKKKKTVLGTIILINSQHTNGSI